MRSARWWPWPRRRPTAEAAEPIRSTRNRRVVEAAALHRARRRRETGRTLLEGPHLIEEALAAGAALEVLFATDPGAFSARHALPAGVEVLEVTPEVVRRLASTETPQGPVAVMAIPTPAPPEAGSGLVAWGVSDPGNVGTLIRTAAAFGWWFAAGPGAADPWSPKVLRAGAGGHFHTTVARIRSLEDLGGRTVVATVAAGGEPPSTLGGGGPFAVLVGDEGAGLPPEVVAAARSRVTIPMPGGTESLNAAVAGAIVVYEASGRGRGGR